MDSQQQKFSETGLAELAQAWWQLVHAECPAQWYRLMPNIDFSRPERILEPQSLPVLDYLPRLATLASASHRIILDQLVTAQANLYFGQTYSESDFGPAFLRQYGWIKLLGPDAYWHSDRLLSGFLILGDNNIYPQHWHEAEELYLPISGDAEWYREGQGWQLQPAGSLIHHASGIKHGTRTIGEPMIALYLWRGGNLTQKSDI
jgi:hypothetical protein